MQLPRRRGSCVRAVIAGGKKLVAFSVVVDHAEQNFVGVRLSSGITTDCVRTAWSSARGGELETCIN